MLTLVRGAGSHDSFIKSLEKLVISVVIGEPADAGSKKSHIRSIGK
jgi:hypothetical protein